MSEPGTGQSSGADARMEMIDGIVLHALVAAGGRALEVNRDRINALNVFPVPDGDTGTNMCLTLRTIVEDSSRPDIDIGEAAKKMARTALLAARGNSGLIAAQLFRGVADAAAGHKSITPGRLAEGMRQGAEAAYRSVPEPREGTMLTVMRESADSAARSATEGADLRAMLTAAVTTSVEAVSRTPLQLDVLRDAGVVDSGGYGYSVFLAGALEQAEGRGDGSSEFLPPVALGVEGGGRTTAAGVRTEFVEASREMMYGYCTVFVVEGEDLDIAEIRQRTTAFGESAVVAGDRTAVKIHVHPLDPGPVLSYGAALGTLGGITILNMDEQTADWATGQGPSSSAGLSSPGEEATEQLEVAFVAVSVGDGLAAVFAGAGLGACFTVPGGDSMNPSVGDLLAAVESAPSRSVIILPNNRNIVAAALQVPDLTDKDVRVVATTSVQAGIAAALAFSPSGGINGSGGLEANVEAMQAAADAVAAGSVTTAVRDAEISGKVIAEGDVMALVDGTLVATAPDPVSALVEMVRKAGPDAELITIYSGDEITRSDAEAAAEAVRAAAPGAEVEVIRGGQPHHHYLVSFE